MAEMKWTVYQQELGHEKFPLYAANTLQEIYDIEYKTYQEFLREDNEDGALPEENKISKDVELVILPDALEETLCAAYKYNNAFFKLPAEDAAPAVVVIRILGGDLRIAVKN